MYKLGLEKAEESEIKQPTSVVSQKKQENSRKNIYFTDYTKSFDCVDHNKQEEEAGLKAGREGDEMVGWHHHVNGREFEQTPGDGEGQGSLVCCSPWGQKESYMTQQLNNDNNTVV